MGRRNIFEAYTDPILEAAIYYKSESSKERHTSQCNYRLNIEAIEKLCEIDSPISSNILHKVANIRLGHLSVLSRICSLWFLVFVEVPPELASLGLRYSCALFLLPLL